MGGGLKHQVCIGRINWYPWNTRFLFFFVSYTINMEVTWIKKKHTKKTPTWIVCLPSEIRNPSGNKYQTKQRQKRHWLLAKWFYIPPKNSISASLKSKINNKIKKKTNSVLFCIILTLSSATLTKQRATSVNQYQNQRVIFSHINTKIKNK